jgi:ubiquinol-cytochrome c reductase cytochrome c1 subunit
MRITNFALAAIAALTLGVTAASAQEHAAAAGAEEAAGGHHLLEPAGGWDHDGFTGFYDQNALQRGFKVYREICSSCHSLDLLSFRNLGDKGGPFYNPAFPNPADNPIVKQVASEYAFKRIDPESGDLFDCAATPKECEGKPADHFPNPYANEAAARAGNGGALPPDFSVITKARHGEAGYIYSLMLGYHEPPQGLTVSPTQHYNVYFAGDTSAAWSGDPRKKPPGGFLAMPEPLKQDGLVTFDDNTPSTKAQMAKDVAVFLQWAGDPKMETRKQMGLAVLGYLAVLALFAFLSYKAIWRNVEH